jgi:ubiquinone/menaquinone biosynthesis C-methylase UbiE
MPWFWAAWIEATQSLTLSNPMQVADLAEGTGVATRMLAVASGPVEV